jgi:hypothetical protein
MFLPTEEQVVATGVNEQQEETAGIKRQELVPLDLIGVRIIDQTLPNCWLVMTFIL